MMCPCTVTSCDKWTALVGGVDSRGGHACVSAEGIRKSLCLSFNFGEFETSEKLKSFKNVLVHVRQTYSSSQFESDVSESQMYTLILRRMMRREHPSSFCDLTKTCHKYLSFQRYVGIQFIMKTVNLNFIKTFKASTPPRVPLWHHQLFTIAV